jgi:hypothetical protein
MPHFYFHIFNGTGETHDDEGVDLPDLDSARAKALSSIRSILREEIRGGMLDFGGVVRITDEHGELLLEIPFATAVQVKNENRYSR